MEIPHSAKKGKKKNWFKDTISTSLDNNRGPKPDNNFKDASSQQEWRDSRNGEKQKGIEGCTGGNSIFLNVFLISSYFLNEIM